MGPELARSARHAYSLGVLLIDIDHFKLINDRHGHLSGDRVIAALGSTLGEQIRRSDHAARWGGEEFGVALLSTSVDGALVAAERIRAAVEALVLASPAGERIPVTASVGLAMLEGDEPLERLVDRADRAMYASKTGGRNRVTLLSSAAIAA